MCVRWSASTSSSPTSRRRTSTPTNSTPRAATLQLKRLARVKAERDSADVAAKLAALSRAAEGTDNLMHALIDCANAYCTVGEMVSTLKVVWGEFQQPVVF